MKKLFSLVSCVLLFSCTRVTPDDGPKKPTIDSVSLELSNVTATTAIFSGHLDVDASLLPASQVILYYSDAETFNFDTSQSVSVTLFDNNQNFTISLTDLKYNTKYNYCVVLDISSEKITGNVLEFTTGNISLNLSLDAVTETTARISGIVEGLSESDKSIIEVGVAYSSDEGKVQNGEGTILPASEIPPNGVLSFTLSDLESGITYYYCSYVKQGETYVYGSVLSCHTIEQVFSLLPAANCFIVSEGGTYKFNTVKGGSDTSVGKVASATVLWESFGTSSVLAVGDLIKSVSCKNGYITFQTADTFKEGNAVIAAKDVDGNILWSWHIWLTDQPEGQVYNNDAGILMDRNLGATSVTPGEVQALGLFYQWGRKDPFLGSSSISSSTSRAKSTINWPKSVKSDQTSGTIEYAIANPTTYISYNDNYDWHYTGTSTVDNTRWTESSSPKSIYDPCPAGWRVPDGGREGVWVKANDKNITVKYHEVGRGMNMNGKFSPVTMVWYPAAGFLNVDGVLVYVSSHGRCWSATPYIYGTNTYGNEASCLHFAKIMTCL